MNEKGKRKVIGWTVRKRWVNEWEEMSLMDRWMSQWTLESNEWIREWVNEWMNQSKNQDMSKWVNGCKADYLLVQDQRMLQTPWLEPLQQTQINGA